MLGCGSAGKSFFVITCESVGAVDSMFYLNKV